MESMMTPVHQYIIAIRDHHPLGVKEQTHYPALANLLNEIGKNLRPKIRCVMHPAGQDANLPDGGLFSASQFPRHGDLSMAATTTPERGVIEAKPLASDVAVIAQTPQVKGYLSTYKQVLVTTYRDFLLVDLDPATKLPRPLERYSLAASQDDFLVRAQSPKAFADAHDERLTQFLTRVMLHPVPLEEPKLLAFFLASYARDAKARIDLHSDLRALESVKAALEQSLGLSFVGPEGEAFFRSTLVQTLFYGVFSAWVLWHNENPSRTDAFNWRNADWFIHVPFIRALFEQVATKAKLEPLGLVEPLDWASNALSRVGRHAFFANFNLDHAVTYFYEPFLQHFDPHLRKQLGVWYTPPEIVQYMVQRVDTVLREELDVPDGLAADNVFVLDPCCGTGAYLMEVLRRIEKQYREKGEWDALSAQRIKHAAMKRVVGFEIMPAPLVVSHLQLGLLLQKLGAPFQHEQSERAAVYLTNSLTGWESQEAPKPHLLFPEMEEERDAAHRVKAEKPILVIMGNPPYNAYAGVSPEEEGGLVEPYKKDLNRPVSQGGWGIMKFNLDDLYVRFFRVAERRIAEMTGKGVVCFISNHSWISEPSFVVLRKKLLESFDKFWVENLHGNRKISEYTPEGRVSETIFAIAGKSPGIQQGVATSLWVKNGKKSRGVKVLFRDDLNDARAADRRLHLLESLKSKRFDAQYEAARPSAGNRYSLRPSKVAARYVEWPSITDLCAVAPMNGLMEKRGGALIDINRESLAKRMSNYFNNELDWGLYKSLNRALTDVQARFDPKAARKKALSLETYDDKRIVRYAVRPCDTRYCYYTAIRPVWNEPRPSLWAQHWKGNRFLMSRPSGVASPDGVPFYFTSLLGDNDFLRGHAYYVPLQLRNGSRLARDAEQSLFEALGDKPENDQPVANLSAPARTYLAALKIKTPDVSPEVAALPWLHTLAIGFAPAYLTDNADGIRAAWPRIPLPNSRKAIESSAALGQLIAEILDTESTNGIMNGNMRPEFVFIATAEKAGGGALDPAKGELAITTGWGHAGKSGITMPGSGKMVERPYSSDESAALSAGQRSLLGPTTTDIYLNAAAFWKNIPIHVWNYHIGGYQVLKKWLSYREFSILKRPLTPDEVREFRDIVRRLAALLLLTPELNANYAAVKANAFDWSTTAGQSHLGL